MGEIAVESHRRGRDAWFTAWCPICGQAFDATDLTGEGSAGTIARGKALTHMRLSHGEYFADHGEPV